MTDPSTKAPDPLDIALGAAVRLRRRTVGLSQEALAEKCGVSFQQVQKYENGVNRISFSRLVLIARALGCRVTDLMDTLDEPESEDSQMQTIPQVLTPGATELLDVYESMPADARAALLALLRTIAPAPAVTDLKLPVL